jgi:NADH dehydrogenase
MAGGGFSGVEAIAEVNDYVRDVARRYRRIKQEDIRVILLHAGPRILPELPEKLSHYAQRLLDKRKVDIRLQTRLGAVTAEEAILSDGTKIPTRTLMATIGATPNPCLSALPCEQDRGRIVVNEFLEVPGYPGTWALGDCARVIDSKTKERCPPTAQYATREAKCLANNIVAEMNGKKKQPFSFSALGMMGSLGQHSAVGDVMGFKVSGLLAWAMWRAIYWAKLPGFNRKFRVALNWALHPFLGDDTVPIDPGTSEEIAHEHFEPGETVFKQGEQGDRLFVIVDGEVEVVREDGAGTEQVLAVLAKGECFGEMALISGAPRGATARTKTRVDALTLRRSSFKTLFENLPQLRQSFEELVARRTGPATKEGSGGRSPSLRDSDRNANE